MPDTVSETWGPTHYHYRSDSDWLKPAAMLLAASVLLAIGVAWSWSWAEGSVAEEPLVGSYRCE